MHVKDIKKQTWQNTFEGSHLSQTQICLSEYNAKARFHTHSVYLRFTVTWEHNMLDHIYIGNSEYLAEKGLSKREKQKVRVGRKKKKSPQKYAGEFGGWDLFCISCHRVGVCSIGEWELGNSAGLIMYWPLRAPALLPQCNDVAREMAGVWEFTVRALGFIKHRCAIVRQHPHKRRINCIMWQHEVQTLCRISLSPDAENIEDIKRVWRAPIDSWHPATLMPAG